MIQKLFVLLIVLLLKTSAFAQISYLDSLQQELKTAKDEKKGNILFRIAEIYRVKENYARAKQESSQLLALATDIKSDLLVSKAYTMLSIIELNQENFAEGKKLNDSLHSVLSRSKEKGALSYLFYADAYLNYALMNKANLIELTQKSLKLAEETHDNFLLAKLYYFLFASNQNIGNEDKELQYAEQALNYALKTDDFNLIANCYHALSIANNDQYFKSNDPNFLKTELKNLESAVNLFKTHQGHVAENTYALSCLNLANFYTENANEVNENKASFYAKEAINVARKSPNSQVIIANGLGILSAFSLKKSNLSEAEGLKLEAYNQLLKMNKVDYFYVVRFAKELAKFYSSQHNFEKAFEFSEKASEASDKMYEESQLSTTKRLEVQFETEKKNAELKMLQDKEDSHRMQRNLFIGLAGVSIVGLVFMFRSYHFKLKYSLGRERFLQQEMSESTLKLRLQEEEQARLLAEQKLAEWEREQLRKEMLAKQLQIEHKNEMLLDIKNKFDGGDAVNIKKILSDENLLDRDFEEARLRIQEVHPNFFNLLTEASQGKLSSLDFKYCAYLHLNLDTKQIAQLLHVEAKSVRMTKYRIKQKLGLDKDNDLSLYLQQLGNKS